MHVHPQRYDKNRHRSIPIICCFKYHWFAGLGPIWLGHSTQKAAEFWPACTTEINASTLVLGRALVEDMGLYTLILRDNYIYILYTLYIYIYVYFSRAKLPFKCRFPVYIKHPSLSIFNRPKETTCGPWQLGMVNPGKKQSSVANVS